MITIKLKREKSQEEVDRFFSANHRLFSVSAGDFSLENGEIYFYNQPTFQSGVLIEYNENFELIQMDLEDLKNISSVFRNSINDENSSYVYITVDTVEKHNMVIKLIKTYYHKEKSGLMGFLKRFIGPFNFTVKELNTYLWFYLMYNMKFLLFSTDYTKDELEEELFYYPLPGLIDKITCQIRQIILPQNDTLIIDNKYKVRGLTKDWDIKATEQYFNELPPIKQISGKIHIFLGFLDYNGNVHLILNWMHKIEHDLPPVKMISCTALSLFGLDFEGKIHLYNYEDQFMNSNFEQIYRNQIENLPKIKKICSTIEQVIALDHNDKIHIIRKRKRFSLENYVADKKIKNIFSGYITIGALDYNNYLHLEILPQKSEEGRFTTIFVGPVDQISLGTEKVFLLKNGKVTVFNLDKKSTNSFSDLPPIKMLANNGVDYSIAVDLNDNVHERNSKFSSHVPFEPLTKYINST